MPQLGLHDQSDDSTLMLVDGHNMIFRSFSSVPRSITDPDGNPVNGVYGLLGALLKLIRERRPGFIAVAFDQPEVPTFRHRLFPDYQGQRGPLGGEHAVNFAWQVTQAGRVLEHYGVRCLSSPGFEADDVIGTLARQASADGFSVLIISTDRDLQQLVDDRTSVLIPGKKPLFIGPDEVRERLGIDPEQVVDWKVLAGDPSDNVPGVPGFGDKGAIALLAQFGTLGRMYERLDDVPPRYRRLLTEGRAEADLFSQVVPIRTDLPLGVAISDLKLDYGLLPERAGPALRDLGLRPPDGIADPEAVVGVGVPT